MAISYQKRTRGSRGQQTTRWTATVRRDGVTISATFFRKDHAQTWAVGAQNAIVSATETKTVFDREAWIRRGRDRTSTEGVQRMLKEHAFEQDPDRDDRPRPEWTLRRALEHYEITETPKKKGAKQEAVRLAAWRARPLAGRRLDKLTAAMVQDHIDARIAAKRAAMTVRNEVLLLSAVLRHAAAPLRPGGGNGGGWGLTGLVNPVPACALPAPPQGRSRRLEDGHKEGEDGEEERLRAALLAGRDGVKMEALFTLALETGMRLSELLDLRASQVRRARGARFIARPDSKNGGARRVVLSTRAAAATDALIAASPGKDEPLIGLGVPAVEYRWKRARTMAGITGLTLHDLRHEGLSRMAGAGLTIGELQAQSGHRSAQILLRYVNAKPADVARKLG